MAYKNDTRRLSRARKEDEAKEKARGLHVTLVMALVSSHIEDVLTTPMRKELMLMLLLYIWP